MASSTIQTALTAFTTAAGNITTQAQTALNSVQQFADSLNASSQQSQAQIQACLDDLSKQINATNSSSRKYKTNIFMQAE